MSYTNYGRSIFDPPPSAEERAIHHGGWTIDKQQAFIDHLAETGRVRAAARMAGMSVQSAYKLRARLPGFAFGWRAAMALAYDRMREIALDRVEEGVLTPNVYRGEVGSVAMRYSDRLLLGLLAHLKPTAEGNFAGGHREAAIEPAAMWAAAVDSYATAIETDRDPAVPRFDDDGVVNTMTRAEFLAAIAPRHPEPRPDPAEDDERYMSRGSPSVSPL